MNRLPVYEVLKIAHEDATKAYRHDLSNRRIAIRLMDDGWHVDYEIVNPAMVGGSPHYVICPETGEIMWKTYQQ